MNENPVALSRMCAVTISREYGSGGGEIAARLAKHLGWQLIDHEIVGRVAREVGVSEQEAAARDEHAEGILSRILNSLQFTDPAFLSNAPPVAFTSDAMTYHEALSRVVEVAVSTGHVVIVVLPLLMVDN